MEKKVKGGVVIGYVAEVEPKTEEVKPVKKGGRPKK